MSYGKQLLDNLLHNFKSFPNCFVASYTKSLFFNLRADGVNKQVLNTYSLDETKVLAALKQIKPKMTTGPEFNPSLIISNYAYVLADLLTAMKNICLKTGVVSNR